MLSNSANQNVDEQLLTKMKKKSSFDPYCVYNSLAASRKPLTVTQPNLSISQSMVTIPTYPLYTHPVGPTATEKVSSISTKRDCQHEKNEKSELFRGFEDVSANLKVLSALRQTLKRKFKSEKGRRLEELHDSKVSGGCNSKVLLSGTIQSTISRNVLKLSTASQCSSKHRRTQSDSQRHTVKPRSMLRRLSNECPRNNVDHSDSSRNLVKSPSPHHSKERKLFNSQRHSIKQIASSDSTNDSSRRKQKNSLPNDVRSTLICRSQESRKMQVSSKQKSKDKSGPVTIDNMKISAPSSALSNCYQISGNILTMAPTKAFDNGQRKYVFRNTEENTTLPIKKQSSKTVNKTLKTATLRLEPLNVMNQWIKSAKVIVQPLKCCALNICSSEYRETVISGGVEYCLTFIDGKYKVTEKQKHTKVNQKKSVEITESVATRHVEPLFIDDMIPVDDDDEVNPKLCDTSVQTDFQPPHELRDFSCQTMQTDVIKIKTEILESTEVSVQTDAQMLKIFCDFSCQTMFPDAMSESLSSVMELRSRITELEQSLVQCTEKFRLREMNFKKNLLQSQKRTEICQKTIDKCDRCSGRCNETTSASIQTPFNQWTSTPVQPRAGTPLSSLHMMQNMFQIGMTTTPRNSPMLPTSNSTSRGEIVPYGFIPQTIQPSTSFGVQNMLQNASTTALVNSPQPASTAANLISRFETAPYNFMPHQPQRISPMCTPRPKNMFSGVPQRLIARHNVGQYNFQQALPPNQSLTSQSHQQFGQQQHPHSLPMASVQDQQWQHQYINCACVQCFQQRHQSLPSRSQNGSQQTYNSTKQVQRQPLYNQQLRQQQLSQQHQQQTHQQQLQALRQGLHQQQSHQQELVQEHVVKQRIGTERQAIERLEKEQAVLEATGKCLPKKVSVKKYLPKND